MHQYQLLLLEVVRILKHQENIIKRKIENLGVLAKLSRKQKNKYGEEIEPLELFDIKGFFHTQNNYVGTNLQNSGETLQKTQPMFFTMLNSHIQKDDLLTINNVTYKIKQINDINNLNVVIDLSLEVI